MSFRTVRPAFLAIVILWAMFALLSGCDALQPQTQSTIEPTKPAALPTQTATPVVTQPSVVINELIPLVVWLPPQFDPDSSSEASRLMKERLETFNLEHPNLAVSYRVKNDTGPAGLLGSLSSTSKVAPQAIPDLVLFSDDQLTIAIEGSLVYPYPNPLGDEDSSEWYDVAAIMSGFQEQTYSLPLAADGLVMMYKTNLIEDLLENWDDLTRSGYLVSFPAADPEASLTLALYLSQGGALSDADGNLAIDVEPLHNVLNFYAQLENQNQLPHNPSQIESDQEAWELFQFGSRQIGVTYASRYFDQLNQDLLAAPLLTADGTPTTMINGWGWALTNPDPNKQVAAAELARYLTAPEFTGPWTKAARLLPLRPAAIVYWEDPAHQAVAEQLLPAAILRPAANTTSIFSQIMLDAVISVLNGEQSAQEAAEFAAGQFGN